ncbi:oxidoreductase [Streptomyces albiflavescens]|uniref:Oxidoreductase n=1 Tax=Streptomyces albiflavescens TaxID=1623582 RepID=A0A918D1Q2_9ACTN|nr:FAD-dependent oxidoreductase [Streptomyces albiflavescens]GGN58478.1 oxidoreductase [Streptomyces albiflavescens]
MSRRHVDVLVVGAGPAGLALAARLAAWGVNRVEVLEREQEAGGVPRHCRRREFDGPGFARRYAEAAVRAGAIVRTGVTALGWCEPPALDTVGPAGRETITATAVVLATGARERPRSARLVAGTRPAGVFTTGELQQAVHLYGQYIGHRAVVVGAEAVSYATVGTLLGAGVDVVAMVTDLARHQGDRLKAVNSRLGQRIPLLSGTTVTELRGRGRLTGVALRHRDGRTTTLACDTVVFTGDFVPDHELARRGGLALDTGTRGPAVDGAFRTSREGVFAVGNVLHAVESAAAVAREGVRAARHVRDHLAGASWPPAVPLLVAPPLRWIAPNRLAPATTYDPFVLRTAEFLARPVLTVTQDGRVLHRRRLLTTAVPNRALSLDGRWVGSVDPAGGPVRVTAR